MGTAVNSLFCHHLSLYKGRLVRLWQLGPIATTAHFQGQQMKVKIQCEVRVRAKKLYSKNCIYLLVMQFIATACTPNIAHYITTLFRTAHLVREWVNSLVTTMADGPTATVQLLPLPSTARCRSTP